jgi:hypothetical protein
MDPIRRPIHPRTQRRRDLAASLNFPAELREAFAMFSRPGGLAVLEIISREVVRHGACTLTVDAIADLASIDRSVVRITIRIAKAQGLITVERGRTGPNTITLSPKWKSWLDRYGDAPPDATCGG